jgi:hypothetical protein
MDKGGALYSIALSLMRAVGNVFALGDRLSAESIVWRQSVALYRKAEADAVNSMQLAFYPVQETMVLGVVSGARTDGNQGDDEPDNRLDLGWQTNDPLWNDPLQKFIRNNRHLPTAPYNSQMPEYPRAPPTPMFTNHPFAGMGVSIIYATFDNPIISKGWPLGFSTFNKLVEIESQRSGLGKRELEDALIYGFSDTMISAAGGAIWNGAWTGIFAGGAIASGPTGWVLLGGVATGVLVTYEVNWGSKAITGMNLGELASSVLHGEFDKIGESIRIQTAKNKLFWSDTFHYASEDIKAIIGKARAAWAGIIDSRDVTVPPPEPEPGPPPPQETAPPKQATPQQTPPKQAVPESPPPEPEPGPPPPQETAPPKQAAPKQAVPQQTPPKQAMTESSPPEPEPGPAP